MAKSDTITRQNLTTHTAGAPWSVRDAANFLGVSARHLARLIDEGKIASIMLGRRRHGLQGHRDRLQAVVGAGLSHALVKVRRRRLLEGQLADAEVERLPRGAPVAGAVVARHGDVSAGLLVEFGPPTLMEGHRCIELKLLEIRP